MKKSFSLNNLGVIIPLLMNVKIVYNIIIRYIL